MKIQENIGHPVPLTTEEHSLLMYIYNRRLRFFITVYLFLIGAAFFSAQKIDGSRHRWSYNPDDYSHYSPRDTGLSRMQMYGVTISLLESFVLLTGIFIYRKRIGPLKKDAATGLKVPVYYPVTQKQHFDQTGQFFIGTDHPDYLFHEVDFNEWTRLQVGDNFAVYRAPASKYVFNARGKYTVI